MTDTERPSALVTPRGRTLTWRTTIVANDLAVVNWRGAAGDVEDRGSDFVAQVGSRRTAHPTLDAALREIDARADETVAALLPPGSIVVSEERVRELAKVLVARVGPFCGEGDCGVCVTARDEFLSALRAGAQS